MLTVTNRLRNFACRTTSPWSRTFANMAQPEVHELLVKGDEAKASLMEEVREKGYPDVVLSERQVCDIELLLNGGFNPLKGFLNKADTESVYNNFRLTTGELWPMPVNLDISTETAKILESTAKNNSIALRDREFNLIAVMDMNDVWEADKEQEANSVFGGDPEHPAIKYLYNQAGDIYVGGKLRGYQLPPHYDYTAMRHTPAELKAHFNNMGWGDKPIVAFQTRNPMHRAHVELVKRAANNNDANILIHPVVGMTKPGDVDYHTRIKCIRAVIDNGDLEGSGAGGSTMSVLPLAMRMGGPREALWHMLIRKNYGATHFILGRDHAGPGSNSNVEDFYGPYDARDFGTKYSEEVGIKTCDFEMMVYLEDEDKYVPESDVDPANSNIRKISGTEVRRRLQTGEDIPEWFSAPKVIQLLRQAHPPAHKQGVVLFFTGLSGSGKSTIANALLERLLEVGEERKVTVLDGDHVRQHLSSELGFSREHRDLNIQRIGFVASEIAKHGGMAICAAIAPYENARNVARSLVEEQGQFVEIFVSASLEACEDRDRKGLYAKARAGDLKGMTGIDDPYEAPTKCEINIPSHELSVAESVDQIMDYLKERGIL
jgi:sulfate adenylyltransferase